MMWTAVQGRWGGSCIASQVVGAELGSAAAHSLASQELGGVVKSLDWDDAEGRSGLEAVYLEMT